MATHEPSSAPTKSANATATRRRSRFRATARSTDRARIRPAYGTVPRSRVVRGRPATRSKGRDRRRHLTLIHVPVSVGCLRADQVCVSYVDASSRSWTMSRKRLHGGPLIALARDLSHDSVGGLEGALHP